MVKVLPDSISLRRRDFLEGSAGLMVAAILSACGSSSSTPSRTADTGAQATGAALVQTANATATALNNAGAKPGLGSRILTPVESSTSAAPTQQASKVGPQGYVYSGSLPEIATGMNTTHILTGVWFIQWTENNGMLTGQSQCTYMERDKPQLGTAAANYPLQGTRDGPNLSFVEKFQFGSSAYSAIVERNALTVTTSRVTGEYARYTLVPGTAGDYSAASQTLKQQADQQISQLQATQRAKP